MFILYTFLAVAGLTGTLASFTRANHQAQHGDMRSALKSLLVLAFSLTIALASGLTAINLNS